MDALVAGTLPRAKPAQIWAGTGTDKVCAACGTRLTLADVEFELEFTSGVSVIVDRHCYAIWSDECERSNVVD